MNAWDRIAGTIASEFSDIKDLEELTRVTVRLLVAAVLGALLGLERERAGKAAGLRTHILVALGGAIFVLVPLQAGMEPADLSRVLQGVVAGVGFLCAGTILKSQDEDQVRGLTTAAGLWLTAAIGLAAGMGREMTALLSALLAFAVLRAEAPLVRLLGNRKPGRPD